MGFVPEDDSHCRVRSLPSVSSPSSSHLGFDGLTGRKKERNPKILSYQIQWENLSPVLFSSHSLCTPFAWGFNSLLYLVTLSTTPRNTATSIPCTHTHPGLAPSTSAVVIFTGSLRNSHITFQGETYVIGNCREVECDFTNTEMDRT